VSAVRAPTRRARCHAWSAAIAAAIAGLFGALTLTPASAAVPLAWSSPASVDSAPLLAVSCASAAALCAAVDNAGNIAASANAAAGAGAWSAVPADSANAIFGVSCVSGPLCVAVDSGGNVVTSTDPTGGAGQWTVTNVDGSTLILSVSCASSSLCVAVDSVGNALVSTHPASGGWTVTKVSSSPLLSVSCASASFCAASDENGEVVTSSDPANGTWAAPSQIDPNQMIDGLSCPTATLCVAVDEGGNVLSSTDAGANWAAASVDGGVNSIDSVSCPSSGFCVAVDNAGNVLSSSDPAGGAAAWAVSPVASGDILNGVSCASASLCVAVDQGGGELTAVPGQQGPGAPPAGAGAAPAALATHTLSVELAGSGRGTVSFAGLGLQCSQTCSAAGPAGSYPGTFVAAPGSHFAGWSGACGGTGACTVTLATDETVTATFVAVPSAPAIRKLVLSGRTAVLRLAKPALASGLQCALVRVAAGKRASKPKPAYAGCGAAVTYRRLKNSGYVFYARSVGAGGVHSPAATRSFTVR